MSGQYIIALDAGTTSNRCIIFDKKGRIISMAQKEFAQIYPEPSWVEHDPEEIWSTMVGVVVESIAKAGIEPEQIAAIGITNQRETTICWNRKTGKPVYNAIVWQCRRTAAYCSEISRYKDLIHKKTGLILDPYFSATKIKWILDNVEGVREAAEAGDVVFGTVETWLIYKLTGGKVHVTDYSNASRTMLFNINTLEWDDELLAIMDIPKKMLPQVRSNSEIYGVTSTAFFKCEIPIAGMAGDQQAALFGHMCVDEGEAKNTYGTGCFLLMNTGSKPVYSDNGLITTVAWNIDGKTTYALEGSVFIGGAVIQWLRDEMGLIDNAAETEEMALKVEDTNGCFVVPAFTGLGAPYWDPYARGTILGLTRGVNKYHIVRAALDSVGYEVEDVLETMKMDSNVALKKLRVDGGACINNYLMQFQSDISSIVVERPSCVEATALGAAYLAGLAVGFWADYKDIKTNEIVDRDFRPDMPEDERKQLKQCWKKAIEKARGWI